VVNGRKIEMKEFLMVSNLFAELTLKIDEAFISILFPI
jgi:hypothetical protein